MTGINRLSIYLFTGVLLAFSFLFFYRFSYILYVYVFFIFILLLFNLFIDFFLLPFFLFLYFFYFFLFSFFLIFLLSVSPHFFPTLFLPSSVVLPLHPPVYFSLSFPFSFVSFFLSVFLHHCRRRTSEEFWIRELVALDPYGLNQSHHSLVRRYSHSVMQHLQEGVDSQVQWWRICILLVGAAVTGTDRLSIYPFTGVLLAFFSFLFYIDFLKFYIFYFFIFFFHSFFFFLSLFFLNFSFVFFYPYLFFYSLSPHFFPSLFLSSWSLSHLTMRSCNVVYSKLVLEFILHESCR